jgi:glutamate 5-kinase
VKRAWLNALADDVAQLAAGGTEVVLVSSGAIAVGRRQLGLTRKAIRLEEKQAAAATGQIQLAHAYQEALARHKLSVSQVLVTLADTEERRRHLNARSTIATLLRLGAVPVINENDTVATSEIRFGDNDRLAARVAAMIDAEGLVLLSDIDGLYSGDPKRDPNARFVDRVDEITPEIEAMAGDALPGYSSGGMVTKLAAARIAVTAGCHMAIAQGRPEHALRSVAEVEGRFERGDALIVRDPEGREVARGLTAYSDDAARRIIGHKSTEIEQILGYRGREELIHRDDLALS